MLQWVLTYHESSCLRFPGAGRPHTHTCSDRRFHYWHNIHLLCVADVFSTSSILPHKRTLSLMEKWLSCWTRIWSYTLPPENRSYLKMRSGSIFKNHRHLRICFECTNLSVCISGIFPSSSDCSHGPLLQTQASEWQVSTFFHSLPSPALAHSVFFPAHILSLLSLFLSPFLSIGFFSLGPSSSHTASPSPAHCVPNQLSWLHNRRIREKADE